MGRDTSLQGRVEHSLSMEVDAKIPAVSEKQPVTITSFRDAYQALQKVSAFLEYRQRNTSCLYFCPLPNDEDFRNRFRREVLESLDELGNRWAESEGPTSDEIGKKYQQEYDKMLETIVAEHRQSLEAISEYLPTNVSAGVVAPLSREDIEEYPKPHYTAFGKRVIQFADAIGKAAQAYDRQGRLTQKNVPRKLLRGWRAICSFLDRNRESSRIIKDMNRRCDGPIKSYGRGKLPVVYEDELVVWWNQMEERAERPPPTVLPDSHPYGRSGERVYPNVKMHEKRRRSDRGKKRKAKNDKV